MVCLLVGAHHLTSPPSQSESLLAMFDPLSSHDGKLVERTFGLLSQTEVRSVNLWQMPNANVE